MGRPQPHDDEHDRGLQYDVNTLLRRRRMLGLLAGAGLAALTGCAGERLATGTSTASAAPAASGASTAAAGAVGATASAAAAGECTTEIPEETAGPYPGDGSNGPNILTQSGIVRSDIRSSFGSASGVAGGVLLTVKLAILDLVKGCAGYQGAAVYLWHCDREGRYSMYSRDIANENYLRGVQEADPTGLVTFTTIFPGAYSGRWPHMHFEVYPTLAAAISAGNKVTTSQLALPEVVCRAVYATDGYTSSVANLARTSLATDNVFGDGAASQLATVTGDISSGFVANLSVPVRG
jgi:protocatechuate 3,4-dioxygenase beta subunit